MDRLPGMTGRVACRALVSAFLMYSGLAGAQAADGACEGTVSGQVLRPLPDNTAFDVDIYDNSEANIELRERFLQAIELSGRKVAAGGPLMISVISERLFPNYRPDTRAVGRPTTQATTDQLGVNRTRSTIGNLQPAPTNEPTGPDRRYEEKIDVRFEVRNATTKEFVWIGQLSCSPLTDNRSQIVNAIFDAFVRNVGKSVSAAAL